MKKRRRRHTNQYLAWTLHTRAFSASKRYQGLISSLNNTACRTSTGTLSPRTARRLFELMARRPHLARRGIRVRRGSEGAAVLTLNYAVQRLCYCGKLHRLRISSPARERRLDRLAFAHSAANNGLLAADSGRSVAAVPLCSLCVPEMDSLEDRRVSCCSG